MVFFVDFFNVLTIVKILFLGIYFFFNLELTLRDYQHELAEFAIQGKNDLIVAPTGSGKTHVAIRIIQVKKT